MTASDHSELSIVSSLLKEHTEEVWDRWCTLNEGKQPKKLSDKYYSAYLGNPNWAQQREREQAVGMREKIDEY